MSILVSVIIPCHNSEKSISECIDSIINQTYRPVEIICVENNSTDDTYNKLVKLSEKNPELFTVLKETNTGASNARNAGMQKAKGEWIQFMDADDFLLPEKIATQVNLIKNKNADLIVGNYLKHVDSISEKIISIKNNWEGLIKGRLGFTSSNLWKKETVMKAGGWDEIKSSQEAYLMFKLLKLNAAVLFDDTCNTIKIENSEDSISKTNVKENIIRYINLRTEIWSYLEASGMMTKDIMRVLKINIFDSIRILYSENKEAGIALHDEFVKNNFTPEQSSSTSKFYLLVYKLTGFKAVQRLTRK